MGVNEEGGNHGRREEFYAFKNLDAVIDHKVKPMDVATRRNGSSELNGVRGNTEG